MDKEVQSHFALLLMESQLCEEEPKTVAYNHNDVDNFVSQRMKFIQV